MTGQSTTRLPAYRIALIGILVVTILIPAVGVGLSIEASNAMGPGEYDFVFFIGGVAVLGGTSVVVGTTILWRKPGNRIGLVMVVGGLLLMSTFTAWAMAVVRSAAGDVTMAGLALWWGTVTLLPAIILMFPAIGILFPDERLPGPRWRAPIAVALVPIAISVVLQTVAPWPLEEDFTTPNPLAVAGLPVELSEIGGGLAAIGTFALLAIAVAAVVVRFRRSSGVERAQQKWLVASVVAMAIAFPVSYATDVGPDELIDVLSVFTGALVPMAVGVAILRYHVFEIDRIVSRTIAYALVVGVLVAVFGGGVVLLSAALASFANGQTIAVAGATLVAYAIFQPVLGRVRQAVDRRFDRARYDGERTAAAFSERLRDETDLATVTDHMVETARSALAPAALEVWLRQGRAR